MQNSLSLASPVPNLSSSKIHFKPVLKTLHHKPILLKFVFNSIESNSNKKNDTNSFIPTMSEIMAASKAQNLNLQLQTLGPFFRVSARSLETGQELGRAEGLVRVWFGGRILHLDSIRMRRETLGMQKSIFGLGLFVGAVAVRHGFDCGCRKAELLAINDTDLYHSKVVADFFYLGFSNTTNIQHTGYCAEIYRKENKDKMQQQVITICENARLLLFTRKGYVVGEMARKELKDDTFSSLQEPS